MQIGLFNLVQKRDPKLPAQATFQSLLDEVKLAEDIGMDVAWLAEHHFSSYSLCVSPLLAAGWLAGHTKRIRLAPGVLVLPLYEPLRMIQEFEMLNLMTGDRIDFGIGTGYQTYEFERFGIPLQEGGDRTLEIMDMFHQAMDTGTIKYDGKFYKVPETGIAVRAHHRMPTVYAAAAMNHPKIPREVVRRGYVPFLSPAWNPFEGVLKQREVYDKIASEEGVDPNAVPLAVMRFVHVTDSKAEALEAAECFRFSTRVATALRFNYAKFDGTTPMDIPAQTEPSVEDIVRNTVIGDADTVAEKIVSEAQALRATHYSCMINVGSLDPKKVRRSLETFGNAVLPKVRRAFTKAAA